MPRAIVTAMIRPGLTHRITDDGHLDLDDSAMTRGTPAGITTTSAYPFLSFKMKRAANF
jgi:hypothetical protein